MSYLVFIVAIILIIISNIWMIYRSFKRDEERIERNYNKQLEFLDGLGEELENAFYKGFNTDVENKHKKDWVDKEIKRAEKAIRLNLAVDAHERVVYVKPAYIIKDILHNTETVILESEIDEERLDEKVFALKKGKE